LRFWKLAILRAALIEPYELGRCDSDTGERYVFNESCRRTTGEWAASSWMTKMRPHGDLLRFAAIPRANVSMATAVKRVAKMDRKERVTVPRRA